jgi:hypothetical protein
MFINTSNDADLLVDSFNRTSENEHKERNVIEGTAEIVNDSAAELAALLGLPGGGNGRIAPESDHGAPEFDEETGEIFPENEAQISPVSEETTSVAQEVPKQRFGAAVRNERG